MVRRLSRQGVRRSALLWYAGLVVVPALVFGALLWQQLLQQHEQRRDEVPRLVRDAATRLSTAIREEFEQVLRQEEARPFYQYRQDYFDWSTVSGAVSRLDPRPIPSPLLEGGVQGIRAWYEWDLNAQEDKAPIIFAPQPYGLSVAEAEQHTRWRLEDFEPFVEEVLQGAMSNYHEMLIAQGAAEALLDPESTRPKQLPIELVALNSTLERDPECVRLNHQDLRKSLRGLENIAVRYGPFQVEVVRNQHGALHVIGERKVVIDALPDTHDPPDCFIVLGQIQRMVQGFDLDPEWVLRDLPASHAERILGNEIRLHPTGSAAPEGDGVSGQAIDLWEVLDVELPAAEERPLGRIHVSASLEGINRVIRTQLTWLTGVTAAMVVSLLLGTRLLLRSVRQSQEQARRTENFVAAVTHELRTPIASVKMYGEMLRDGWARDEERRASYLDRVVSESDRLAVLVDRILTQRMLNGYAPTPEPGSVTTLVSNLGPDLSVVAGEERDDVELVLAPGLPPVLMVAEGVREIVVNLVENARKYAPVPKGGEPIRVEVRQDRKGRVVLEVSDRGPGIPASERASVFDAFYRLGDEKTRKTSGTGLGLHLVQLQAKAMKARVQLKAREGGGTTFRVVFKTLKPGTVA